MSLFKNSLHEVTKFLNAKQNTIQQIDDKSDISTTPLWDLLENLRQHVGNTTTHNAEAESDSGISAARYLTLFDDEVNMRTFLSIFVPKKKLRRMRLADRTILIRSHDSDTCRISQQSPDLVEIWVKPPWKLNSAAVNIELVVCLFDAHPNAEIKLFEEDELGFSLCDAVILGCTRIPASAIYLGSLLRQHVLPISVVFLHGSKSSTKKSPLRLMTEHVHAVIGEVDHLDEIEQLRLKDQMGLFHARLNDASEMVAALTKSTVHLKTMDIDLINRKRLNIVAKIRRHCRNLAKKNSKNRSKKVYFKKLEEKLDKEYKKMRSSLQKRYLQDMNETAFQLRTSLLSPPVTTVYDVVEQLDKSTSKSNSKFQPQKVRKPTILQSHSEKTHLKIESNPSPKIVIQLSAEHRNMLKEGLTHQISPPLVMISAGNGHTASEELAFLRHEQEEKQSLLCIVLVEEQCDTEWNSTLPAFQKHVPSDIVQVIPVLVPKNTSAQWKMDAAKAFVESAQFAFMCYVSPRVFSSSELIPVAVRNRICTMGRLMHLLSSVQNNLWKEVHGTLMEAVQEYKIELSKRAFRSISPLLKKLRDTTHPANHIDSMKKVLQAFSEVTELKVLNELFSKNPSMVSVSFGRMVMIECSKGKVVQLDRSSSSDIVLHSLSMQQGVYVLSEQQFFSHHGSAKEEDTSVSDGHKSYMCLLMHRFHHHKLRHSLLSYNIKRTRKISEREEMEEEMRLEEESTDSEEESETAESDASEGTPESHEHIEEEKVPLSSVMRVLKRRKISSMI